MAPSILLEPRESPTFGLKKHIKLLEPPATPSTAAPTALSTPLPSPQQASGSPLLCAELEEAAQRTGSTGDDASKSRTSWLFDQGLVAFDLDVDKQALPADFLLTALSAPPTAPALGLCRLSSLGVKGFEIHGLPPAGPRPRPLGRVVASRAVATEAALHMASLGSKVFDGAFARSAAQVLAAAAPNRKLMLRATHALAAYDSVSSSAVEAAWSALACCAWTGQEQRALLQSAVMAVASEGIEKPQALSLWDWWLPCHTSGSTAPLMLVGTGADSAMASLRQALRLLGSTGEAPWAPAAPAVTELQTACFAERVLASTEGQVGKRLLNIQSIQDLSPGTLTSCVLLAVERPSCLALPAPKAKDEEWVPAPGLFTGRAEKRRMKVLVDDLSLPLPTMEVASGPEALFWRGSRPSSFVNASLRSSELHRRPAEAEQLLLQRRAPPSVARRLTYTLAAAARFLEVQGKPTVSLLALEASCQAPLVEAWNDYLGTQRRAQREAPRLVASVRTRAALAAALAIDDLVLQEPGAKLDRRLLQAAPWTPSSTLLMQRAQEACGAMEAFRCCSEGFEIRVPQTAVDAAYAMAAELGLGSEVENHRE
eukprot:TRINITY_DN27755_c0_g1_i1.p1 TRINITY_DN27755_c0_g1~~TRINITY_DN27755_c0_g1_i1.p1  ORF type:complete len:621 (-),score=160.46 TRINITY_DN27755_c0_g1_i1:26-1819(-)